MLFLLGTGQQRPNRFEETERGEDYHLKFARYCASSSNTYKRDDFLTKTRINKMFYKNHQWIFTEDTELFFKDDTDQDRNRLKFTKNIIRPMVNQYKGNAARMMINARVKAISTKAINRREEALEKMLFMNDVAKRSEGPLKENIKNTYPLGDTHAETASIFDNLFVDKNTETMNGLLQYVAENNRFEEMQMRLAEELTLSGLAVVEDYEFSSHQMFDIVPSEEYFFDPSAKKYDLTDSEYMGRVMMMLPTEIFEEFQVDNAETRESIENYAIQYNKVNQDTGGREGNRRDVGGRVPVIKTYWKDISYYEYAYVNDEAGYPYLTKINFTYPGEEEPRYTDKDIIEVKSQKAEKLLKGKKSRKLFFDELRFCIFIPREIVSSPSEKTPDIILDYGLFQYPETDNHHISTVKFPFKAYCWGYVDGEIVSPVDDAINPQRFINRLLSISENQINNAGGSGTFYDSSFVKNEPGAEAELLRNMAQSKPVGLNAKGRGMQNAVVNYDNSIKAGTMVLFNIIDMMDKYSQDVTGINEALKGESMGSDQLVGVTQLMLQRGTLMQEPFYYAITNIFLQCYQSVASRGKRIYADNERELAIAVGDEGARLIKITKDMKLEDFRSFVKRSSTEEQLNAGSDAALLTMLQLGLIDDTKFANLYGRSTPDDIGVALRQAAKERKEIGRVQKQEQAVQDKQIMDAHQAEKDDQTVREDKNFAVNEKMMDKSAKYKMDEIYAKGQMNIAAKQVVPPNAFANAKPRTQAK